MGYAHFIKFIHNNDIVLCNINDKLGPFLFSLQGVISSLIFFGVNWIRDFRVFNNNSLFWSWAGLVWSGICVIWRARKATLLSDFVPHSLMLYFFSSIF